MTCYLIYGALDNGSTLKTYYVGEDSRTTQKFFNSTFLSLYKEIREDSWKLFLVKFPDLPDTEFPKLEKLIQSSSVTVKTVLPELLTTFKGQVLKVSSRTTAYDDLVSVFDMDMLLLDWSKEDQIIRQHALPFPLAGV